MDEVGIEQAASNYIEQFAANKPFTVVSCWHANKGENAVMWHAYTNVKAGIMVRSTYEKLKDSIKDSIDRVHISEVKYLDYEKNVMLVNSTNFPFVHKHHFYQDEKEIRALIQVAQPNSGWNWEIQESQKGLFVKCNPEILIDEVIVAPFAEQSYFDIVRDVSLKYGLDKPVRYSGLRG